MTKKKDYTALELLFSSDLFLKGEELYEAGAVTDIQKLEKNLYIFTVKEGGVFEVEWLKPLSKNQRASCECGFFAIGKMCKHAVAALLAYKNEIKQQNEAEDIPIIHHRAASLSINNILPHLTKEDLKQFVKSYASTDKKFATAMKVHFARKVDVQDNEKKYKSILDGIIKPVSTGNHVFKTAEIRQLLSVTDEFFSQADDALALGQYYEALLLIKHSLLKLCYVFHYTKNFEQDFHKAIIEAHKRIIEIYNGNLSIDVTNAMKDFLNECAQLSYYPFLDLKYNAIAILEAWSSPLDDPKSCIEDHIKRKLTSEEEVSVLLALYYLYKLKQEHNVEVEKRHLPYVDKIAKAFYTADLDKALGEFCAQNLTLGKECHLFHIQSLANRKDKSLSKIAASYFLEKNDLRIVDLLKLYNDELTLANFRKWVENKFKLKKVNPQIYMQYLAKTGANKNLLDYLIEQKDFRYLMQYDAILMKEYEPYITDLYVELTEQFLNTYLGKQSQHFMDELFSHLHKINATKVVNKLSLMIEMKFPHRSSLDELVK